MEMSVRESLSHARIQCVVSGFGGLYNQPFKNLIRGKFPPLLIGGFDIMPLPVDNHFFVQVHGQSPFCISMAWASIFIQSGQGINPSKEECALPQ